MHAIMTKFIGPSNTKGQRVKAWAPSYSESGPTSITLSWNSNLDPAENYRVAAKALAEKLGWKGTLHSGYTAEGYVFVFLKKVNEDGHAYHVGTRVGV